MSSDWCRRDERITDRGCWTAMWGLHLPWAHRDHHPRRLRWPRGHVDAAAVAAMRFMNPAAASGPGTLLSGVVGPADTRESSRGIGRRPGHPLGL